NQMVGSVEPRAEVWERIKAAIGHSGQRAPLVLPEPASVSPHSPVAHESEAARVIAEAAGSLGADIPAIDTSSIDTSVIDSSSSDNSNVVQLIASARRWRAIATATSAI